MKPATVAMLAGLLLAVPSGVALSQGIELPNGETVIAANVQTGAKFVAIVRDDKLLRVNYVTTAGVHVPLNRMVSLVGGQCNPGWAIECHQAFGAPQRICFCVAGKAGEGSRAIDTTTGEINW